MTGFHGPNGAGESATIRLIRGLDAPTSGRVLVDGRPYRTLDRPRRQVGALLDAAAMHGRRPATALTAGLLFLAVTLRKAVSPDGAITLSRWAPGVITED